MRPKVSRRTVLRGLGAAVALPALEAMLPGSVLASTPKRKVVRLAFLFVPNGIHMPAFTPNQAGAGYD